MRAFLAILSCLVLAGSGLAQNQFNRIQATPVITKGATYDGIVFDSLAAPSICRNMAGTGWIAAVDGWNVAASKWYSTFFTSTDLVTWTHVASSTLSPTGGNYINGNSGIIAIHQGTYSGQYGRVYAAYASAATPVQMYFDVSSDLLTWTSVSTSIIAKTTWDSAVQFDASLSFNPVSNKYEIWYCGSTNATSYTTRCVGYADSTDCTDGSWTKHGPMINLNPTWYTTGMGEPSAMYYHASTGWIRYLSVDASESNTYRFTALYADAGVTGTFISYGSCNSRDINNSWELGQVNDATIVPAVFDRGDGRGPCLWMMYAGDTTTNFTDATTASMGLLFMVPPAPVSGSSGLSTTGAGLVLADLGAATPWVDTSALYPVGTVWASSPDGTLQCGDLRGHAALWMGGISYDLGSLGSDSTAYAVSNSHQVVGESLLTDGRRHAFSWTASGGMVDLTPDAGDAVALCVSGAGMVGGTMDGAGFLAQGGILTDINTLTRGSPYHVFEVDAVPDELLPYSGNILGRATAPFPVYPLDPPVSGDRLVSLHRGLTPGPTLFWNAH